MEHRTSVRTHHHSRSLVVATTIIAIGVTAIALGARTQGSAMQSPAPPPAVPGILWRLNTPHPTITLESRANPIAVPDKMAARAKAMEERALLRAYEGAPPVIPHATEGMNIQTCRECHAQGLVTGNKVARMVSHTYLPNCTQCHVEAKGMFLDEQTAPKNIFAGLRSGGYGGTRAGAGAPPVIPHGVFMRTNCTSCHGEHGYNGWRPDHLSRTNCVQCHAPAAEFEQLNPAFGIADVPDGTRAIAPR